MNAECGMRNAEFDWGVVRVTTLPLKTPHSALRIPHSGGVGVGMVRIIAGEFKGRRLKTPAGDRTRPTADRVREAWLSILQHPVRGARALDLFAGSGALGLEALSRGAVSADFVENHRTSLAALNANIKTLKVGERATVHKDDALRFAERLQPGQYDVVFADPPYAGDLALDLFAGSGALGLEALSRGAVSADFVENHRTSLAALNANIKTLKVGERATVHKDDALRFAERLQPGQYDVVFADPPYAGDL